jgi:hypothetical protein
VVEKIPVTEMAVSDSWKKIHADLIRYYKEREWTFCEHAIEGLVGKWNGELDTFYTDMLKRVLEYKVTPPDESWDGVLRPSPAPV